MHQLDKENTENSSSLVFSSISSDAKVFIDTSSSSIPSTKRRKPVNSVNSDSCSSTRSNNQIQQRNAALLLRLRHNETKILQESYGKIDKNEHELLNLIASFQLQDVLGHVKYNSLLELWTDIQEKGLLNGRILKWFSSYPPIISLNFTATFGHKISLEPYKAVFASVRNPKFCTVPLWNGFIGLETLDFSYVDIEDEELRYIMNLSNLQQLNLSHTKITLLGLVYIAQYARFRLSLHFLSLQGIIELSDSATNVIPKFPNLTVLDISQTGIGICGVRKLGEFFVNRSLKSIVISQPIFQLIAELHAKFSYYSVGFLVQQQNRDFFTNELKKFELTHGKFNLNAPTDLLKAHLLQILRWRQNEEFIWSIASSN